MEGSLVVEELLTKICLTGYRFFWGANLPYFHCHMFVTSLRSDIALLDHLKKNLRNLTHVVSLICYCHPHQYDDERQTSLPSWIQNKSSWNLAIDTMIPLARICRLRIYEVLTCPSSCTESVVLAYTHSFMRWWWGQQHAKERDQVSKPFSDPWTWVPMSLWLGNQY